MKIPTFFSSRYLLPLDRVHLEKTTCDLLIIGGGIAGLAAAIAASEEGVRVLLVTKDTLEESNSYYAQGGIAAVLDASDSIDLHIKDTIDTGMGLSDEKFAIDLLTRDGACHGARLWSRAQGFRA